jgi:molybdopterin converting factor small subunit
MQLDQGATVGQVLEKLNIPGEMPKIIFINGLIVKSEAILKDGDRAGIFPPLAGG